MWVLTLARFGSDRSNESDGSNGTDGSNGSDESDGSNGTEESKRSGVCAWVLL